jgi:phosphoserine phosphatase
MWSAAERRAMALVAFDFDGTLSQSDLSVLLGREHDVANEIRGLTEQGIRGDVDFERSLRQRVSLLEGMPADRVAAAFERAKLRGGAGEILRDLRRSGHVVAIITGTFEEGVRAALDRAGVAVDHVVANRLVMENDALTGEVEGPLVDRGKDEALEELVAVEGFDRGQVFVVGNGASDLPMLKNAGTAIGYNPAPIVEDYCDRVVTSVRKLRLYFEQHGVIETT